MEALDDGGGVDEVAPTQDADEVRVELRDLDPGGPMHDGVLQAEQLRSVQDTKRLLETCSHRVVTRSADVLLNQTMNSNIQILVFNELVFFLFIIL